MVRQLKCIGLLACVASFSLMGPSLAQQPPTMVCMADGMQIKADRFEVKDGKFIIFVTGASAPTEYPVSAVKGINVPCAPGLAATAAAPAPSQTASNGRVNITGSHTIGERLMPMLIETYGLQKFGAKPKLALGKAEELDITLGSGPTSGGVIELRSRGSTVSFKALGDGTSIIGMASRRASDEEAKIIQGKFNVDLRASGSEHVLALDALAIVVHRDNPITQLTPAQLAQIFAGQITNWSAVGGPNAPISSHRREDKYSGYEAFATQILAPLKLKWSASATVHKSNEVVADEVARDPFAIGLSPLPYVNRNRAVGVADVCGLATLPTSFTVKTETYPLGRRLYLYSIGRPTQPIARDLLDFAMSEAAQPLVQEAGLVDQRIEMQEGADQQKWQQAIVNAPGQFLPADHEVPIEARDAFAQALAGAQRSSITLRFERGSAALDTRAQQDVARLAQFLMSPVATGKRFWLVGFADAKGSWSSNRALGSQRAASASQALQSKGIQVRSDQLTSFSYMAPIACNDTEEGRAKNRRVEIWLAR